MSMPSRLTAFLALCVAGCASAPSVDVPDKLRPGAGETLAMVVPARGVQIYECRAAKEGAYEWAFVAPEAELFDAGGRKIGKHYAGPSWEAADGSIIVGAVKERADAPAPNAIPWLLLSAKSVGSQGAFAKVTSVQRVHTVGGVAPKGCFQPEAGKQLRVGYTADYYFYAPK
jgi:hypothetical protein